MELADDQADAPTMLELGSLRLVLIRRGGDRLGLRVRDTSAPVLRAFDGLDYFDIDPRWRLTGRLLRGSPDATIPVPDVLGNVDGRAHARASSSSRSMGGRIASLPSRPGPIPWRSSSATRRAGARPTAAAGS